MFLNIFEVFEMKDINHASAMSTAQKSCLLNNNKTSAEKIIKKEIETKGKVYTFQMFNITEYSNSHTYEQTHEH